METTRIVTLAKCHLTQTYDFGKPCAVRIISLRPLSITFPYETGAGEHVRGAFLLTADDFPFASRCRGRVRYTELNAQVTEKPYTWKALVVIPPDSSGTYEHLWSSAETDPVVTPPEPVFCNAMTITLDFIDYLEPPSRTIDQFADVFQPICLTFEVKMLE